MSHFNFTFIPTDTYTAPNKEKKPDEGQQNKARDGYDFTFRDSTQTASEEGSIASGLRHTLRSGARAAETLLGLPGDFREVAKSAGEWAGNTARSLIGLDPLTEKQQAIIRDKTHPKPWDLIGRSLRMLPTSHGLRKNITQALTGDYLEPQGYGEELSDEFVSDITSLLTPAKGANGALKIPFARAIGTALFANTSGEAAKAYGLDPTEAAYVKMGTMLLAGFAGKGGARNYVNGLYRKSLDMIPQGATMNGKPLLNQLDSYIASLKKGGISPQKQPALSLANQLKQKVVQSGGDIHIAELPAFRRSVNDYRFNRQSGLTDSGRYFLDRFDDILNNQLMGYGKQNPAFLNKYREANTGLAGFKQSNKIASYISKKIDISKLSPDTLISIGIHMADPSVMAKIGTSVGVAASAQLIHRIGTNPVLRQYYLNVLQNALKDNAPAMVRNLERLNVELTKSSQRSNGGS